MKDDAASSVTAFLFAGVIFLATLSSVLLATDDVGSSTHVDAQEGVLLSGKARTLLDLVVGTAGVTASGGDWVDSPDDLTRLGLQESSLDGATAIDFAKLENLRRATHNADAGDGLVNYEEARASLGLDALGLDFHVRAYPSLQSVAELLEGEVKDENLRVTYIGDADTAAQQQAAAGATVPSLAVSDCIRDPTDTGALQITFSATNPGDVATQFHLKAEFDFGSKEFEDTQRGGLIAPGGSETFSFTVPGSYGDCDDINDIETDLFDPSASLLEREFTPTFSDVDVVAAGDRFRVDPDRTHYTTEDVVIAYDGKLDSATGNSPGETLTLEILDSGGVDVLPTAVANPITVPKGSDPWVFDAFPATDLSPGEYTVVLKRAGGQTVTDTLLITSSAVADYHAADAAAVASDHVYSDAAKTEAAFLEQLVYRFCPYVYDSASVTPLDPATWDKDGYSANDWSERCDSGAPFPAHSPLKESLGQWGDIFPDDKQLLADFLPDRLDPPGGDPTDIVNTLVVGSNVDHNTMTAESVKGAIKDWVFAGGNLIVFGSEKQVVQWLQPIFKASIDSANGPISAPDDQHPLLQVSDTLDWDSYNDNGNVWNLKQDSGNAEFTQVVGEVAADGSMNSVLAISNAGAYGSGTVMLTSWLPYNLLSGTGAETEGLKLVNNLLMQGYRDLFLDYGPEIPDGVAVGWERGRTQVYHPQLERFVTLDVVLYVFSG